MWNTVSKIGSVSDADDDDVRFYQAFISIIQFLLYYSPWDGERFSFLCILLLSIHLPRLMYFYRYCCPFSAVPSVTHIILTALRIQRNPSSSAISPRSSHTPAIILAHIVDIISSSGTYLEAIVSYQLLVIAIELVFAVFLDVK